MKFKTLKVNTNIWFTSDLHLNHKNIIYFCNRPFETVEDMNRTIISNWNSVVQDNDIVFLLGDICYGGVNIWVKFMKQLRGRKILVMGNHDKSIPDRDFEEISPMLNILVNDPDVKNGQRITLCHYPMISWYQSHKNAWQLFGHMHNRTVSGVADVNEEALQEIEGYIKNEYDYLSKLRYIQYDVGVDGNNFTPVSYYQIKEIINSRKSIKV